MIVYNVRKAVPFLNPKISVGKILQVVDTLDATFYSEDAMWDFIEYINRTNP